MITTTNLIDFRKAPNKVRKKLLNERKAIRKSYIKVIMRKKYLENTLGFNVRWTENDPELEDNEIIERFGDKGNLIYATR